jgi:hypothetical protein
MDLGRAFPIDRWRENRAGKNQRQPIIDCDPYRTLSVRTPSAAELRAFAKVSCLGGLLSMFDPARHEARTQGLKVATPIIRLFRLSSVGADGDFSEEKSKLQSRVQLTI